jgi:hypothetical protein
MAVLWSVTKMYLQRYPHVGNAPLLDLCLLFILLGVGMFLLRQRKHKVLP